MVWKKLIIFFWVVCIIKILFDFFLQNCNQNISTRLQNIVFKKFNWKIKKIKRISFFANNNYIELLSFLWVQIQEYRRWFSKFFVHLAVLGSQQMYHLCKGHCMLEENFIRFYFKDFIYLKKIPLSWGGGNGICKFIKFLINLHYNI